MPKTNAPLSLRHAREEVILELSALTPEVADYHRRRAKNYMREAIRGLKREPERGYDWALLRQPH